MKNGVFDPPEDALNRFLLISKVLLLELNGDLRFHAVQKVAGDEHFGIDGGMIKTSERSLYRWLDAYERLGFEGLLSLEREKIKGSLVIPRSILDYFSQEKKVDPCVSIPELIKRAEELGMVASGELNRVTVWRSLNRLGVDTRRRKITADQHMRRFAYPHRMDMILCDGKHFRAGVGRLKRVALFFLDDATRMVLHVVVGTSENTRLFLRGLYEMIRKYGLMSSFYVDRGPGFFNLETISVFANLKVPLIYGKARYPEGHGKIEKFNQTAKNDVLRYLDGNPEVEPGCEALELRLRHFLAERYNPRPHESLDAQSPLHCFKNDERPLRFPPSEERLKKSFVLYKKRRVSKDNIIKLSGHYEVPFGHAGTQIMVRRNVLSDVISIIHDGKEVILAPVDVNANARDPRPRKRSEDEPALPLPKSSAQIAFEREFKPVIDSEGNVLPEKKNDKE